MAGASEENVRVEALFHVRYIGLDACPGDYEEADPPE